MAYQMTNENYVNMCSKAAEFIEIDKPGGASMDCLLKQLSGIGIDGPTVVALKIFMTVFPDHLCCECKGVSLCENCRRKQDYISRFKTIYEIVLVLLMQEKFNKQWDFDKQEWR